MSIIRRVRDNQQEYGLRNGTRISAEYASLIGWRKLGNYWNFGQNHLNKEWDLLILLDACRFDLFQEFGTPHSLYSEFSNVKSMYSCASTSVEYIEKVYNTADEEELEDVHLVSANGWETKYTDLSKFSGVTPVWEYDSSEYPGAIIPPSVVTDSAIYAGRHCDYKRMIVHYMQPHAPFLNVLGKYDSVNQVAGEGNSQKIWDGLQKGQYSFEEVWNDYGENLLLVLDEVYRLIDNIDGSAVVSADHANAMGEFGIYGHPGRVPLPVIKRVPWAELESVDRQTANPENAVKPGVSKTSVDQHLKDLGYMV